MIPDIKELNFPKKDGEDRSYATLTNAKVSLVHMGDKDMSTQVRIDGEIVPDFSYDWAVEFQGEKYIMPLRITDAEKNNESVKSTVNLKFQHWAIYQLKRWPFVTIQPIQTGTYIADEEVASVRLNLGDLCILFGQVLEYYYGDTIKIDLNPAWVYKEEAILIDINHTKVWDVLVKTFYDKFGVRWEIKPGEGNDNTAKGGERYVIRVGYPTEEVDHIFEYGFKGGLLKVAREVQSENIHNMIKGRGGEKNIPFRYFKATDPKNKDFEADPDWVEELANIPFTNLMPATFRSYVQGWKAQHISKYPGYTAVGESNAYSPWAYRKGYTDTKFHPVEFVADEITVNPEAGDRQIEVLPGYSPYIKKGSSIDKYGPLQTSLDNNDEIYPTLQGTGLDVVVDVEQVLSDDVVGAVDNDAKIEDKSYPDIIKRNAPEGHVSVADTSKRTYFTVAAGKKANITGYAGAKAYNPNTHEDKSVLIAKLDYTIKVFNTSTGEQRSASGIPEGSWYFTVEYTFNNTSNESLNVTCSFNEIKLESATLDDNSWKNTFDIWVKNIWGSSKQSGETDEEYSERVWKPRLGDREKNTAKVVFTSGMLWHEDYEFTIVDFPAYDISRSYEGEQSHWRIRLAKSDAELEATGLYIPSTIKQGKAGDTFAFVGTEMTHVPYVVEAEISVDENKKDYLRDNKEITPTFAVTTDRVRLNNEGKPDALIRKLRPGGSLRLADKRFIQPIGDRAYETLYIQSLTYTYREPSSNDAALNPDVAIALGNEYWPSTDSETVMQGEITALQRQIGSISNVEQIVRAVGDRLYLRKDGIADRSLSPTQFFSLLTSGDFRAGLIGGAGWGFYKDENGNWVLEADRVNVRQEMSVNTLVINQAEGRGGMEIDTAAYMEVTRVVEVDDGYICYFDQKEGTVANLFHIDDVAFCNRWTAENSELKFYKRRVTELGADYVKLSKTDVNGSGIPAEKDNIIHFGNYTDKTRQYVKVRDVVGGGYERFLDRLDSVNSSGEEYYFVGKQDGQNPRWFIGDKDGDYAEWKDGKLNIKGSLSIQSTVGDKNIVDFIKENGGLNEDVEDFVNNALQGIQDQIDGVIETWFFNGVPTLANYPASGWDTEALKIQHLGDLYYDNDTGTAYRFSQAADKSYYWNKITDEAITKAMAAAKKAQDTADGKRRVFTSQPVPPYEPGDLWANATYGKYKDDLLRCFTAKAQGQGFDIADWDYATKYTDDSALNSFIKDYNDTIKEIGTQIDGKAQTWYQNTDPSSSWATAEEKAMHKGDLWYNTTDNTTWYWNGAAWKQQDIPQSVFDTIDGKASIFVSKPTGGYKKNDLWFLEQDYTLSGMAYKAGTLAVAVRDMGSSWSANDWVKKDRYTDDTLAQQAKEAADKAQQKADKAENDAKAANDKLTQWAADGVISPPEKQAIKDEIARIDGDKSEIAAEYSRYGLGTPTAYNNAHKTYRDQLVSLSAATPENIAIPSTFATNQTAYYSQRTEALKAIALAAKAYAQEMADKGKIYARGTGMNRIANRLVHVNGKKIVDSGSGTRGLTLTVLNRQTLALVSSTNYDVYGSTANCDNMATAMNALTTDVLVVITSWDAWLHNNNSAMISAMEDFGGSLFRKSSGTAHRRPYVLIGMKGLGKGNGLERMEGMGADDPYAEISTTVVNGICQGWNVNQAVYDTYDYLTEAMKGNTQVNGGLVLSSMFKLGTWSGSGNTATMSKVWAGMNGTYSSSLGGRTIASWWGGDVVDMFNASDVKISPEPANAAAALVRMDGSAYFSRGNIGFKKDGSGWLGNQTNGIIFGADGSMTFGSGIKIGTSDQTVQSLINFMQGLGNVFVPEDANGNRVAWNSTSLARVKSTVGFYSMGFISAKGLNTSGVSGGGSSSGGATALSGLTDVLISSPTQGQSLVWNGAKWTNQTVSGGGGLDIAALTAYLTDNSYLTQTAGDGRYVTLGTAQTITGQKTFSSEVQSTALLTHSAGIPAQGYFRNGIGMRYPGGNDGAWLLFNEATNNAGWLEIATSDDGTEPIYVRQYNTLNNIAHAITLMDASGNQTFNMVAAGQVHRTGKAGTWVLGRNNALLRTTSTSNDDSYDPLWSAKTYDGSWDCGPYRNNILHFAYITDANFNAGTNAQTADIQFRTDGAVVANKYVKSGGTASQFLMADGSVTTKKTATSVSHTGWTGNAADDCIIPTMSFMAYWNGRYNATTSNLQYCDRGRFGTIVTKGVDDYLARIPYADSQDINAITANGIYWTPSDGSTQTLKNAPFTQTFMMLTSTSFNSGEDIRRNRIAIDGYGNMKIFNDRSTNGTGGTWYSILTSNNYASVLDTRYVKKAGDTMTGNLSMGNVGSITNLAVGGGIVWNPYVESATDGTDAAWIKLIKAGVAGGSELQIQMMNDANDVVNINTNSYNGLRVKGSIVWNQSNDGAGSGLDADLLDGTHKSGLFTQFDPLTNGGGLRYGERITVGGTQRDFHFIRGTFGFKTITKNDNGGRPSIFLLADVTDWSTSSSDAMHRGGTFTAYCIREEGSTTITSPVFVTALCCWSNTHYKLQSSDTSRIEPLILNRTSDSKVFLALRIWNSRHNIDIVGSISNCPLWTQVDVASGDTDNLPSGYTIRHHAGRQYFTANVDGDLTARRMEIYGGTPYIDFHYNNSSADYTSRIIEDISGSLKIVGKLRAGTNTNTYALNAASFICNDWVRTSGDVGWYNQTHGGGWYMNDTTWIRTYGNKSVYQNAGTMRTDGTLQVGSLGATLNVPNNGRITIGQYLGPSTDNSKRLGWDGRNFEGVHSRQFINNTNSTMWIWQAKPYEIAFATNGTGRMCISSAGSVVIGSNGYTAVDNNPGVLRCTRGMYSDGYVSAKGSNTSSDMRLKDRKGDVRLTAAAIAAAPIFRFLWKKGPVKGLDVGSSAQYWKAVLPDAVRLEADGFFSLDYGKTALCSAVSLARAHISLEQRVAALEKENKELKTIIKNQKK